MLEDIYEGYIHKNLCFGCKYVTLPRTDAPCCFCNRNDNADKRGETYKDWYRARLTEEMMPKHTFSCEKSENDPVKHPAHYTQGGIECIDAIRSALTPEEWRGYCKGNIIKYIWRERMKGQDESVKKAVWYADKLLEDYKP